jgi:hypothetical protein
MLGLSANAAAGCFGHMPHGWNSKANGMCRCTDSSYLMEPMTDAATSAAGKLSPIHAHAHPHTDGVYGSSYHTSIHCSCNPSNQSHLQRTPGRHCAAGGGTCSQQQSHTLQLGSEWACTHRTPSTPHASHPAHPAVMGRTRYCSSSSSSSSSSCSGDAAPLDSKRQAGWSQLLLPVSVNCLLACVRLQ